MVVNFSYSFIPLKKISQKGVDRSVENPQRRAESIKMAPNAPNKFSWRMRNKMPLPSAILLRDADYLSYAFNKEVFRFWCKSQEDSQLRKIENLLLCDIMSCYLN